MEQLPTPEDCPECSTQPSQGRRRSVFQRLEHPSSPPPRQASLGRHPQEEPDRKCEESHLLRWCPYGLSKSQKRRVQHLRSLEQAEENYLRLLKQVNSGPVVIPPPCRECNFVWRRVQSTALAANVEASADSAANPSADVNMVFFLPEEFRNP